MPARVWLRRLDRLQKSHVAAEHPRRRGDCVGMDEEAEDGIETVLADQSQQFADDACEIERAAGAECRDCHPRVAKFVGDRSPSRQARDFDLARRRTQSDGQLTHDRRRHNSADSITQGPAMMNSEE